MLLPCPDPKSTNPKKAQPSRVHGCALWLYSLTCIAADAMPSWCRVDQSGTRLDGAAKISRLGET